jgi:hypothetical protein
MGMKVCEHKIYGRAILKCSLPLRSKVEALPDLRSSYVLEVRRKSNFAHIRVDCTYVQLHMYLYREVQLKSKLWHTGT